MTRVSLISNPSAGISNGGTLLEGVRRRLGETAGRWTEVVLRPGENLTALVRNLAAESDVVLAAGGDGTIRAAAEALYGGSVPLGILPCGTVNVLARELGIPLSDPAAAVDIALGESERCLDVGLHDGEPFLLLCSGGVDSATVGQVNENLKSAVGATAYALAAVGALATFVPPTVRVTIDGVALPPTDIFLVAIGNSSLYGGDLQMLPAARLDDGLLHVVLFTAPPLPAAVRNAAFLPQITDLALGRHTQSDGVLFFHGREITLDSDPPIPLQRDGDLAGETPAVFSIAPGVLRVRAPTL